MRIAWHSTPLANITASALLLVLFSCSNTSESEVTSVQTGPYFSIADYFRSEATRLQRVDQEIIKTVSKNGDEEQQRKPIADWTNEFSLFIDSDINKPAWQNSYRIDSTATSLTYSSMDSTLRTETIHVEKSAAGAVTHIHITNRVSNMLYVTEEQLDYYPDSLYRIIKQQQVRIIGKSHYTVTGEWL